MNLSNREELIAAMQQANQPNPQAQQMAMAAQQSQLEFQQSQTAALVGQAAESQARAGKLSIETQLAPEELEIERINSVTRNLREGNEDDKEFERRLKVADRLLKQREIQGKENVNDANRNQQAVQSGQPSVQGTEGQAQQLANTIRQLGGEG